VLHVAALEVTRHGRFLWFCLAAAAGTGAGYLVADWAAQPSW
jgi:hypothetical protein